MAVHGRRARSESEEGGREGGGLFHASISSDAALQSHAESIVSPVSPSPVVPASAYHVNLFYPRRPVPLTILNNEAV